MGRAKASNLSREFSITFANVVSVPSNAKNDWIAKNGCFSLFKLLSAIAPKACRGYGGDRQGISEAELNKALESNGFTRVRVRLRSIVASAGTLLFDARRWLNPNSESDLHLLIRAFGALRTNYPHLLTCDETYFLRTVARHRDEWVLRTRGGGRAAAEALCRTSGSGAAPVLRRGDRAMLIFLPSLDFILAFLACLRAGIVPVPCYPPDPRNLRVNVALFASVCASCGAKVALTHSAYSSLVSLASMKENALRWLGLGSGPAAAQWQELAWWDVEEATAAGRKRASGSSPTPLDVSAPADLAFLQYTSGSTSEPKGVRITHANISHNLATIVASLGAGPDTVVASWLPQYHDMGLIGSYLGVLACGGSGYYMSPLSFLKAPLSWLHMVSRARATHIQAPNFAYALLARRWRDMPAAERVKQAGSLSLTSLRHAFNAAETVTAAALTDFSAAFAPLGFSPAAFAPGYGLAENTVYVCDGGTAVVYLDREVLESSGRAEVLSSCAITALHEGGGQGSAGGCRGCSGAWQAHWLLCQLRPREHASGACPRPLCPRGRAPPPLPKKCRRVGAGGGACNVHAMHGGRQRGGGVGGQPQQGGWV